MVSPVNANGHRRRQLVARVRADQDHCALCGVKVDKDLHHYDPRAAVVDEALPRSRGGSQYDRANCHLEFTEKESGVEVLVQEANAFLNDLESPKSRYDGTVSQLNAMKEMIVG